MRDGAHLASAMIIDAEIAIINRFFKKYQPIIGIFNIKII